MGRPKWSWTTRCKAWMLNTMWWPRAWGAWCGPSGNMCTNMTRTVYEKGAYCATCTSSVLQPCPLLVPTVYWPCAYLSFLVHTGKVGPTPRELRCGEGVRSMIVVKGNNNLAKIHTTTQQSKYNNNNKYKYHPCPPATCHSGQFTWSLFLFDKEAQQRWGHNAWAMSRDDFGGRL